MTNRTQAQSARPVDANGSTRWRADRPRAEREILPADPELARKRKDLKEALAVDAERAKIEYDARQSAVSEKTARLAALRASRDATLPALPKPDTVAKARKPRRARAPIKRAE